MRESFRCFVFVLFVSFLFCLCFWVSCFDEVMRDFSPFSVLVDLSDVS